MSKNKKTKSMTQSIYALKKLYGDKPVVFIGGIPLNTPRDE